ncbi:ATP-binding protein [Sphaerisporangium sp. NPDC005288]|uniref:ATP-binding protein n=1 Tax=Sphaerisporangium sp. NPDC005288 TaxID=3155114 RepID=UPI0033A01DE2
MIPKLMCWGIASTRKASYRVSITLAQRDQTVRLTVRDTGAGTRPRVSDDPSGEGGRGLFLVEQISHCWGVDEDTDGRAVWCEVKF